jgi:hypothetical protein
MNSDIITMLRNVIIHEYAKHMAQRELIFVFTIIAQIMDKYFYDPMDRVDVEFAVTKMMDKGSFGLRDIQPRLSIIHRKTDKFIIGIDSPFIQSHTNFWCPSLTIEEANSMNEELQTFADNEFLDYHGLVS